MRIMEHYTENLNNSLEGQHDKLSDMFAWLFLQTFFYFLVFQ